MKKRITFLFSLITVFLYSQENVKKNTFFKDNVSSTVDVLSFGRTTDFAEEVGTINPQNLLAKLEEVDAGLFLRPNIKVKKNDFKLWIKPRYNIQTKDEDQLKTEFYFQELKLKYQFNDNAYFRGGRYIMNIGTSTFINPSNPYFANSGQLNPKFELRPIDFIEINYALTQSLNITLITNIYKGESLIFDDFLFDFKRSYSTFLEYYGDSADLGAILNITEDGRYHLGYYGRKNFSKAFVGWVDGAFNYKPNRFYPINGHSTGLLDYEMINGKSNEKLFSNFLIGAAYTFNFGPTLNVEYFYNGKGYDDDSFEKYNQMIANGVIRDSATTEGLSFLNFNRGINTGMPYVRRNYIFTQLLQNDILDQFNYALRYFYSMDDSNGQFSSLLEWSFADNMELYSVNLINFGDRDTDFKKLIDYQLMLGLIYKF